MRNVLLIALIGFAVLLAVLPSHAQHRLALVIGSGTHHNVTPLAAPGPANGPLAGNPTFQLSQNKPILPAPAGDLLVEDVPLPSNMSVSNPQNIPENITRFSGAWVGAWGGQLHHILIVESVMADGNANVVYAVGDNPAANVRRQWHRHNATIVGNTLRIERFATYELTGDGKLDATFEAGNARPRATMSRIELADLMRPGETIAWTSEFLGTPLKENGKPIRPEVIPMIGYLALGSRPDERASFRQDLNKAGYIDGRNVRIEFRIANNQAARLPELAADLVSSHAAVIVAPDGPAIDAAMTATSTIPIVFTTNLDPVKLGFVASLNRPGGNITGAALITSELVGKQLDLLHQMVPRAAIFGYLSDPRISTSEETTSDILAASRALGTELLLADARSSSDIGPAFATLVQRGASGIVVAPHVIIATNGNRILELTARNKIAAMYSHSTWVRDGGLMSYGARDVDFRKLAVDYVARILKGAKPADLPVQQPTAFDLVINLNTAKALGLTVPPTLLAIADEVIESPRYGRLGIRFRQITQETAADLHLQSTRGMIVTDVDDTGAAKTAGIQADDVIMRMGGKEILELRDLLRIVAETPANKVVEVVIVRAGVERSINVTLGPEIPPRAQ